MIDPESGVIGSLILDPVPILPIIRAKLTAEDFSLSINKDIFIAACKLSDEAKVLDVITIRNEAKTSTEYITELMTSTPTAAHIEAYINGLIKASMKRRLMNLSDDILTKLDENENPQDVCVYLQEESTKIAESQSTNDLISSVDACTEFYNYLNDISGTGKLPFVSTGYSLLDYILGGGLFEEGLYYVGARPGCGKTTLAIQIAEKVAKTDKAVMFMSLEMSKTQITAKRVAIDTGINYTKVLKCDLNDEEYRKVSESCAKLSKNPFVINRKPGASVDDIAFLAHQVKNLGLIVIDYLQLIRHKPGTKLYERVTDTSNRLKELSRSLGVPILCLAQLNREVEGRNNNKPRASDFRDSGAIEQDADGILLLHRDMDNLPNDDITPVELTCTVGKNRHGKMGELRFNFYLSSGRMYPLT